MSTACLVNLLQMAEKIRDRRVVKEYVKSKGIATNLHTAGWSGGRKSIILLEDSHVSPSRPSGRNKDM